MVLHNHLLPTTVGANNAFVGELILPPVPTLLLCFYWNKWILLVMKNHSTSSSTKNFPSISKLFEIEMSVKFYILLNWLSKKLSEQIVNLFPNISSISIWNQSICKQDQDIMCSTVYIAFCVKKRTWKTKFENSSGQRQNAICCQTKGDKLGQIYNMFGGYNKNTHF